MTISQLVDYVRLNDIHGVWFWGTGPHLGPQNTARALARAAGKEQYSTFTAQVVRLGNDSGCHEELISGCQRLLGQSHQQGGSTIVTGVAMPHLLLAEIATLAQKGRQVHEWLEDCTTRSRDFFFTYDCSRWETIDEICKATLDNSYAVKTNATEASVRLAVTKAIGKFLQVDVNRRDADEVFIREEPRE